MTSHTLLDLMGESRYFYRKYFEENLPCYNGTSLYSALPISRSHFPPHDSWETPIAHPLGRGTGVVREFKMRPKFYILSSCAVCNIVQHCTTIHYNDVKMSEMASQITSLTIVYPSVYLGADQRKHQSSPWLAFVRGIHKWPVNSLHKGPVPWKMLPFDDIIMISRVYSTCFWSQHHKCQSIQAARVGEYPHTIEMTRETD